MKLSRYLVIVLLMAFGMAYAQFDDELLDEDQQTKEVKCMPENLKVGWDSLANQGLQQDIRMLYSFGVEYYKNKSYKESMPYLWKVFLFGETRYKKNAIRKITDMYFRQSMVDSTLIACYRGLEILPDEKTLHHYAGLLQNKLGRFRCAIPHFEALTKADPNNKDYMKTLARCYFKDENEKAIDAQEKVVALDPQNAEEKNTLAAYVSYFRGEGADLEYRKKAYDQDPENVEFALSYAQALSNAGKFSETLEPINKVLAKKPTAKNHILRAQSYENLDRNNDAIKDYKSVLKLEPKNVNIMLRIAENYKLNNSFKNAKYWINKALQTKPGFGQAHITMGELYEAAAAYCMDKNGGKTRYQDKLVYLKAAKEYKKAQKDPNVRSKAKTKYNNVMPFVPTKEDNFMNKGKKIKSPCYTSWM